ncbi:hypothetical protein ACWGJP_01645 [Microbacterium sp. NPDC055903]
MNEVQGPTPAGTSRPYRSLPEALRAHRIDPVNHAFITAIADAIGISSFIDRGRYIEAVRRGEGAALHIGKTYTNGFAESDVIVYGGTRLRLQPSEGRPPYYFVSHPSEFQTVVPGRASAPRVARAAAPKKAPVAPAGPRATKLDEREYGVCDVCFMTKTASGSCGC